MRERWSEAHGQQLFLGNGQLIIESRSPYDQGQFTIRRLDVTDDQKIIDQDTHQELSPIELGQLCEALEHSHPNNASGPTTRDSEPTF